MCTRRRAEITIRSNGARLMGLRSWTWLLNIEQVSFLGRPSIVYTKLIRFSSGSLLPSPRRSSLLVPFHRLADRQDSHQVVRGLVHVRIGDRVSVLSPDVPVADRSSHQEEAHSQHRRHHQYENASPQHRMERRRLVVALQLLTRDLAQLFVRVLYRATAPDGRNQRVNVEFRFLEIERDKV